MLNNLRIFYNKGYSFLEKIYLNQLNLKNKTLFFYGLLTFFCSEPFGLTFIFFITIPMFFINLYNTNNTKKDFIKTSYYFYTGYFLSQFYWFVHPLFVDIKIYFWVLPTAIFCAPLVLSTIFTFFQYITFCLTQKINSLEIKILLFSFSWVFAEYFRGNFIFNGFPWQIFGHFFNNSYLIQINKYINIYSYSFITILSTFLLYLLFQRKKIQSAFIVIFNLALFIFGFSVFQKTLDIDFNIIGSQPNLSSKESIFLDSMSVYNKNTVLVKWSSFLNKKTMTILPESAVRFVVRSKNNVSLDISRLIPNDKSLLIFGGLDYDESTKSIFNAVHFLNQEGILLGTYRKKHLVPFGEYVPLRNYLPKFIQPIVNTIGDFNVGKEGNREYFIYKDFPIIFPMICYDIIFAEDVKNTIDSYLSPNHYSKLIVNVTNDVWTGFVAPYQHLNMAKFAAIRADVNLIRVSNNGISAIINKYGHIVDQTKLNKTAILKHLIEFY